MVNLSFNQMNIVHRKYTKVDSENIDSLIKRLKEFKKEAKIKKPKTIKVWFDHHEATDKSSNVIAMTAIAYKE